MLSSRMDNSTLSMSSPNFLKSPSRAGGFRLGKLRASRIAERLKPDDDGGIRMEKHLVGVMGRMMVPYLWMRKRGKNGGGRLEK
ncbi:unnamed protein product [Camellia sinensis]